MKTELIIAGVACVVAAALGGGLKFLGAEFPLLRTGWRQGLLAAIGVALIAWGAVTPSEQQQRTEATRQQQADEAETTRKQERNAVATQMSSDLEGIWVDVEKSRHGVEVPGLYVPLPSSPGHSDIPRLTTVFTQLASQKATLGELHAPLSKKAHLALDFSNARTSEDLTRTKTEWLSVNEQINRLLSGA